MPWKKVVSIIRVPVQLHCHSLPPCPATFKSSNEIWPQCIKQSHKTLPVNRVTGAYEIRVQNQLGRCRNKDQLGQSHWSTTKVSEATLCHQLSASHCSSLQPVPDIHGADEHLLQWKLWVWMLPSVPGSTILLPAQPAPQHAPWVARQVVLVTGL